MSLRSFFSSSGGELSPAVIIRRVLFLLLLIGLSFLYLVLDFRGLTNTKGVDQAQIAREIARGHGFVTKFVRPLSLFQAHSHAETEDEKATVVRFHDTYHAPLNPLLNSVVLKFFRGEDDWTWNQNEHIYYLDRVIAGVAIVLLLCSIGINYLLISRIFDAKIGGVTALLMLLCELLWEFSQTGLPQMLMLFLFSFALYFLYKAVECKQTEHATMLWLCLTAGFFGLLALAHWIAIWPFIGLIIFVAFYFQPRGLSAAVMLGIFLVIILPWGIRNHTLTGTVVGSGYFALYGGLGDSEEAVLRSYQAGQDLDLQGLPTKLIMTSLAQLNGLYTFLGSIIAAPIFFISLLHPFKRPEISWFRWCILLMWVFSVIGMSLFGLPDGSLDSNQLHVLFIPIMTAYGLAMLSVLWSRLGINSAMPLVVNGHMIIVVVISAIPMIMTVPKDIKIGLYNKERQTSTLQISYLRDKIKEAEVVVTDVPWNVAWYGDCTALWLPSSVAQFEQIDKFTAARNQDVAGIVLTFESTNQPLVSGLVFGQYRDWAELIVPAGMRFKKTESLKGMPYKQIDTKLSGRGMFFFTDGTRSSASDSAGTP